MCSVLEIEKNEVLKGKFLEKEEFEEIRKKFFELWQKEGFQENFSSFS